MRVGVFVCLEHGIENNCPTIFNEQQTPYVVNYLHELGKHYNPKGDKVFGPEMEAAVRRLQTAKGLEVDGIVGSDTWPALLGL